MYHQNYRYWTGLLLPTSKLTSKQYSLTPQKIGTWHTGYYVVETKDRIYNNLKIYVIFGVFKNKNTVSIDKQLSLNCLTFSTSCIVLRIFWVLTIYYSQTESFMIHGMKSTVGGMAWVLSCYKLRRIPLHSLFLILTKGLKILHMLTIKIQCKISRVD